MTDAAFDLMLCGLLVLAALALGAVVWVCRRREPVADRFAVAFGQMPGFTEAELRQIAPPVRTRDPLRRSFVSRPLPPAALDRRSHARYRAELAFWPGSVPAGELREWDGSRWNGSQAARSERA